MRIKTVDGSNVYLDLTVTYKMLPGEENVTNLVLNSGLGEAYKHKWVRDYSRSVCRAVFGELTTEEFYDATKRDEKAMAAQQEMNGLLLPFGLEVERVIAEKFRFHEDYEKKIREKKLADQEVEEQMSKANAALQNQKFREVQATKIKDVDIATFDGKMRQLIVEATAQAEKTVKEAEAYVIQTRRGADARYYEMEKNAQAILATKKAEAEATAKMAQALDGEGGRNIVKLEYTGRLKNMAVTGQPFTVSGRTERFTHIQEGGASAGRPAGPVAK